MPDIIDQLHDEMEDPNLSDILSSSIQHEFSLRYPSSNISIYSTDHPVTLHVRVDRPPHDYYMVMTDEWVDQNDFRFTFTSYTDSNDQVVVDLTT